MLLHTSHKQAKVLPSNSISKWLYKVSSMQYFLLAETSYPPSLSLVLPHPLSFSRVGWGTVTWSTQNFCYGSLCCCVGDCVVRHCHLYPLYSWQDILLTFAGMEFDSTTMFTPGMNVLFIRSTGEPVLAQAVGNHHPRVLPIPVESGEHVEEFKVKWSRTKKFYTKPVKE